MHELAKRLTSRFEVTVLAPHAAGSLARETIDGINIQRFRYAPASLEKLAYEGGILPNLRRRPWTYLLIPAFLLAMLIACRRELRSRHYAAIHAHWIVPQGLIAIVARNASRTRVPLLSTSHGGDLFGLRSRLGRWLKRRALLGSDRVTVVSEAMRAEALAIQPRSCPVDVIPMGVDLQTRFTPDASVKRDERLVLFVGRLVEKKGCAVLLRAFTLLHAKDPQVRLRIIGEGPEKASLQQTAATAGLHDAVEFVGSLPQEQLPSQLRRATVFVMPSIQAANGDQEGLGLVQVEAMGCACPVIASALPAVRDVIVDGWNGLLVPPTDSHALATAIERLLADPALRERLASNALEHARDKFDWERISNRYGELLLSLARHSDSTSSNNER